MHSSPCLRFFRAAAALSANGVTVGDQLLSVGEEKDAYLRSATARYIRGSVDAEQFYEEITARLAGRMADGVVIKMARGMPEDKVCLFVFCFSFFCL